MRQILKISLSLLITLILSGAFLLVAFSGLFDLIEASFFQPRIQQQYQRHLSYISGKIRDYHNININKFLPIIKNPAVFRTYLSQQSEEDIFIRRNLFGKLKEEFGSLKFVRIIDKDGKRIHFSSLKTDIREQKAYRIVYYNLDRVEKRFSGKELLCPEDVKYKLLIDGEGKGFIYSFPVFDNYDIYRGTALFYVSKLGLENYLLNTPDLSFDELALIGTKGKFSGGILINFPLEKVTLIEDSVVDIWNRYGGENSAGKSYIIPLSFKDKRGVEERFLFFFLRDKEFGNLGFLIPKYKFSMQLWMKIILAAAFFMTVFLLVFLIMNLRQDPMVILSERIKRFQIEFLHEYISSKEKLDWEKWQKELVLKQSEVKEQIKKGIGRVSKDRQKEIDELIDKSWEEIITIIGKRVSAPPQREEERVDIKKIEEIIQKALSSGRFTVSANVQAPGASMGRVDSVSSAPVAEEIAEETHRKLKPIEVEELDEAEVEEIEEIEGVEEEEIPEAVEELSEVEEVEEAEAIEEVEEVEEAEDAEEVEEVEEAEEIEPVEELEEVEEVEPVEEAGGLSGVEEVKAIGEVEELSEVEEAEEVEVLGGKEELTEEREIESREGVSEEEGGEELEELPEAEEVEEMAEAEELGKSEAVEELVEAEEIEEVEEAESLEEVEGVEETEPIEELEEVEEIEKFEGAEEIEELEPVPEIKTLPPEPVETGIEELPMVEEEVSAGYEEIGMGESNMEDRDLKKSREDIEEEETLEEVEEVEEIEEVEPIEELEEVEEIESIEDLTPEEEKETIEKDWVEEDEETELTEYVKQGFIKVYSIEDFANLVKEIKHSIVMEDGVYKIKEDVFKSSEVSEEESIPEEESELSIGALFGDEESEDIFKDVKEEIEEGKEEFAVQVKREKLFPITERGLNYDEYLKYYSLSINDNALIKSFVDTSRFVSAIGIASLILEDTTYRVDLKIGFEDLILDLLKISNEEPFGRLFLKERNFVFINKPVREIKALKVKFPRIDFPFIESIIFFPLIYKGGEGYLVLAFSKGKKMDPETLIKALNIV